MAIAAMTSVQVVFAGFQILGKIVLNTGLNPIAFALLREVSSSFVFLIAMKILIPRSAWPRREHLGRFLLCGLSMFGNVFLGILALTMTSASTVALLQPTQPVIASVLTFCLGHEGMSIQKAFGIILSCAGSLFMAMWQHGAMGSVNVGILLVLAQCLSGANYVVQQRPLVLEGYSPLTVSGCSYVIATVFTAVTGGVYFAVLSPTERTEVEWYEPTTLFVLVMFYVVFLVTVYNYVVIAWATGKLGATVVTLFLLLQGVIATVLEWQCFDQPISLVQALASLGVFAGLIAVVTAPGKSGYVETRANWASSLAQPSLAGALSQLLSTGSSIMAGSDALNGAASTEETSEAQKSAKAAADPTATASAKDGLEKEFLADASNHCV